MDFHTARALLDWQIELGATEALLDAPVDRYALDPAPPKPAPKPAAAPQPAPAGQNAVDPVAEARTMAEAAQDLEGLRAAMAAYPHCELQKGARNLVFADGDPAARVMIIGEAPGRDEDREGKPFVGRAGHLLDQMLAAIGMGRTGTGTGTEGQPVYITNVLPWRPPQNRDPKPDEIAMLLPFVQRHVALAAPEIVVLMGNTSCQAGLGRRGITRLRGAWTTAFGKPALPMFHPAYLLRNPHAKREAWHDLLMLQAKLREPS